MELQNNTRNRKRIRNKRGQTCNICQVSLAKFLFLILIIKQTSSFQTNLFKIKTFQTQNDQPIIVPSLTNSFIKAHSNFKFESNSLKINGKRKETLLMGIPKLFRWLTDQYPSINQRISEGLKDRKVDNFYLDMNGIIHMCTHANNDELVMLDEKEMFQRIFIYTDRLFKIVRPKRLMFLAVDGPAPRAKMNQQRSRRFRAAKEREAMMAEMLAKDQYVPDKSKSFDSNCITPGTEFMYKLGKAFNRWIEFKMANDPFWQEQGAKVIFSGPDVPGEGEHKVMDYIREARDTEPDWQPGMSHCMYGLDADLIMLSLVTHEPNFFLLREKMSVRHSRGGRKPKDPLRYVKTDFELLEIKMLRDMLHLQFRSLAGTLPFEYSLERIVDDFVFICMLVGNDFLPNMPHLDIADGALNLMMSCYREMLPKFGGYLTDKTKIHRLRFELFVSEIARREPLYFMQRGREEQDPGFANPQDPLAYKDYYYKVKLGFEPEDSKSRQDLVTSYLEGLYWVLQYYHEGCSSWSWFYPYHYAPLASDLRNLAEIPVKYPKGRPFSQLMQLLTVLPMESSNFVPQCYAELMTPEPTNPLMEFFPADFESDPNGKKNSWEAVVMIPFLDYDQMVGVLSLIDHKKELSLAERKRNILGLECAFLPPKIPQKVEE
mmetsp:Transcript_22963/g.29979  ORF Transcript_22963/g.29979 Transcript_22963/m.29979 type:complete len:659 (-) Transcript_22963:392-2368(-)